MRKKRILFVLFVGLIFAAPASAALVNFDDIAMNHPAPNWSYIPSSYQGFNWGYAWDAISNTLYQGWGSQKSVPSLDNAAAPAWAGQVTIYSSTPFNVVSAYFSSLVGYNGSYFYVPGMSSSAVTVTGYRNSIQQGSPVTIDLAADAGFVWAALNLANVNTLVFLGSGNGAGGWLMDNFEHCPAVVPLPTTLLLLSSGLMGLVGIRRKFQS
jgi:hypothetical protein